MENADQEKVKEKLREIFERPISILEEKFPKDFSRIEALKNNLYDLIYGNEFVVEVYKKQTMNKIEFKKNNSAGEIITDYCKNNCVTHIKTTVTKTPTKYRKIKDEIVLTPTSNVKSGDGSTNNTKKIVTTNIGQLIKDNKNNTYKNNYSPLPIYSKVKRPYVMHLSYNENSKIQNGNGKEENSKSTNNSSIPRPNKTFKAVNRLPSAKEKIKPNLNESVDIVRPSKYNRTYILKPNGLNNIKVNKSNQNKSKRKIKSGSVIANTEFKNNKIKALALFCINGSFPLRKRLNLIYKSKELSGKVNTLKPLLIESRIKEFERKVIILEEKLNYYKNLMKEDTIENYLNRGFIPSKTAQNSLNFLTKEDENNLYKLSNNEQIQNLFRLIYILLKEDYESISPENLITNLSKNIFPKYNVENFKCLFLNHLMKVSYYSDKQMQNFTSILHDNPKLLSSHEVLKISKPLSFLCFIIKEIYEYANLKANDGTSVVILRKIKIKLEQYKLKIQELKNFI